MPKISSVESQKNPHRFNIFLDGVFVFGADEDLVVDQRLVIGKEIAPGDLEKLLFESAVGKLMERMYTLFNIRQRSEKEIRDYLKNLSFKRKVKDQDELSEAAVELLIIKLKQKGLLNDGEFAKSWAAARRRSKQKGKRLLQYELAQKGIAKNIIDQVLEKGSEDYSEEGLATVALQKKLKLWQKLPELEFKKKTYQFLGRKGFDFETISAVIEKFLEKE